MHVMKHSSLFASEMGGHPYCTSWRMRKADEPPCETTAPIQDVWAHDTCEVLQFTRLRGAEFTTYVGIRELWLLAEALRFSNVKPRVF